MTDLSVRMSHGELWPFLTFQQKILVENSSVVFLNLKKKKMKEVNKADFLSLYLTPLIWYILVLHQRRL